MGCGGTCALLCRDAHMGPTPSFYTLARGRMLQQALVCIVDSSHRQSGCKLIQHQIASVRMKDTELLIA